jgi:hypothetical protein
MVQEPDKTEPPTGPDLPDEPVPMLNSWFRDDPVPPVRPPGAPDGTDPALHETRIVNSLSDETRIVSPIPDATTISPPLPGLAARNPAATPPPPPPTTPAEVRRYGSDDPPASGHSPSYRVDSSGPPDALPQSWSAREQQRTASRGGRRALLITVIVAIAGLGLLVGTGVIGVPGLGNLKPAAPTTGFSPVSSNGSSPATQTGSAFLADWQNGNLAAAANITDNPAAALAALQAYRTNLKVSGITINPGVANTFGYLTFALTTQAGNPSANWAYSGGLATYDKTVNGYTRWFVQWSPAILLSTLTAGEHLEIQPIPATVQNVTDNTGAVIDPTAHPSLAGIVEVLKKNDTGAAGTPGQEIVVDNAAGKTVASVTQLSTPVSTATVASTIDLADQSAAEAAVHRAPNSSMVVIQPSTGRILAIANNTTSQYYDTALLGRLAPGSTFKVITSTTLLTNNLVTLGETVVCPATLTINGLTLHNSEGEAGSYSYLNDFAQSCNNAFSSFYNKVGSTMVGTAASTYFGLDENWDIGLGDPTGYASIPPATLGAMAEELVGQGDVLASPLAMASIAATVDTGSFKQPIVVPGAKQITATALPSAVAADLKDLMKAVITSGTAAGVFPGASGAGVYAKTGTAEVAHQSSDNSWFIAFKGDLAVCALAVNGGFGAATAGPEVASFLKAVS